MCPRFGSRVEYLQLRAAQCVTIRIRKLQEWEVLRWRQDQTCFSWQQVHCRFPIGDQSFQNIWYCFAQASILVFASREQIICFSDEKFTGSSIRQRSKCDGVFVRTDSVCCEHWQGSLVERARSFSCEKRNKASYIWTILRWICRCADCCCWWLWKDIPYTERCWEEWLERLDDY